MHPTPSEKEIKPPHHAALSYRASNFTSVTLAVKPSLGLKRYPAMHQLLIKSTSNLTHHGYRPKFKLELFVLIFELRLSSKLLRQNYDHGKQFLDVFTQKSESLLISTTSLLPVRCCYRYHLSLLSLHALGMHELPSSVDPRSHRPAIGHARPDRTGLGSRAFRLMGISADIISRPRLERVRANNRFPVSQESESGSHHAAFRVEFGGSCSLRVAGKEKKNPAVACSGSGQPETSFVPDPNTIQQGFEVRVAANDANHYQQKKCLITRPVLPSRIVS